MLNNLQKNSTTLTPRIGDSSIGALPTNYGTQWVLQRVRRIQTTDSAFSQSHWDRLELCYLALFWLPSEALADIKEEMEYKIQYYQELADYDARKQPAIKPPSLRGRVNEATTRPTFYLPLNDD